MINNTELAEKYKGYSTITSVFRPLFDKKIEGLEYKYLTLVSKEPLTRTLAIFLDGELYSEYNKEQDKLIKVDVQNRDNRE